MKLTVFMCIATLYASPIYNVKPENIVLENAKFNGSLVGKSTLMKFCCELWQRPIGNSVLFQVNFKTVDVITFKNNKCYAKDKECKIEMCSCSNDENKFQMEYWFKRPQAAQSQRFGVEILLRNNESNIVTLTLWRYYDGKEFGKLHIAEEISQNNLLYNKDKINNGLVIDADNIKIHIFIIVTVILILIVTLCMRCICRSHLHELLRKGRYVQLLTNDSHEKTNSTSEATNDIASQTATNAAPVVHLSSINAEMMGDLAYAYPIFTRDNSEERLNINFISPNERSVDIKMKENSSAMSNVAYKTAANDAPVVHLSSIEAVMMEDRASAIPIFTWDTSEERLNIYLISPNECAVDIKMKEYSSGLSNVASKRATNAAPVVHLSSIDVEMMGDVASENPIFTWDTLKERININWLSPNECTVDVKMKEYSSALSNVAFKSATNAAPVVHLSSIDAEMMGDVASENPIFTWDTSEERLNLNWISTNECSVDVKMKEYSSGKWKHEILAHFCCGKTKVLRTCELVARQKTPTTSKRIKLAVHSYLITSQLSIIDHYVPETDLSKATKWSKTVEFQNIKDLSVNQTSRVEKCRRQGKLSDMIVFSEQKAHYPFTMVSDNQEHEVFQGKPEVQRKCEQVYGQKTRCFSIPNHWNQPDVTQSESSNKDTDEDASLRSGLILSSFDFEELQFPSVTLRLANRYEVQFKFLKALISLDDMNSRHKSSELLHHIYSQRRRTCSMKYNRDSSSTLVRKVVERIDIIGRKAALLGCLDYQLDVQSVNFQFKKAREDDFGSNVLEIKEEIYDWSDEKHFVLMYEEVLRTVDTFQDSEDEFMEKSFKQSNGKQLFVENECTTVILPEANEAQFQRTRFAEVFGVVNTSIQTMAFNQMIEHLCREVIYIDTVDCPLNVVSFVRFGKTSFFKSIMIIMKCSDQYQCTISTLYISPARCNEEVLRNELITSRKPMYNERRNRDISVVDDQFRRFPISKQEMRNNVSESVSERPFVPLWQRLEEAFYSEGKTPDRDTLQGEFNHFWSSMTNQSCIKNNIDFFSIADQIENLLYNKFRLDPVFYMHKSFKRDLFYDHLRKLEERISAGRIPPEYFNRIVNCLVLGKEKSENCRNKTVHIINPTFRKIYLMLLDLDSQDIRLDISHVTEKINIIVNDIDNHNDHTAKAKKKSEVGDNVCKLELAIHELHKMGLFVPVGNIHNVLNSWWYCDPTMAPASPGHRKCLNRVKDALFCDSSMKQTETYLATTDTISRIEDLWIVILKDDFVFSLRNDLEVKAYNSMERRCQSRTWTLEKYVLECIWCQAKGMLTTCLNDNDLDNAFLNIVARVALDKVQQVRSLCNDPDSFQK